MYNTGKKDITQRTIRRTNKKNILRYCEYYDIQPIFDNLYKQSKEGSKFSHLYNLIISDENILLAYRTIKRNRGSKTPGTNRHTIKYWENKPIEEFLKYIKGRLRNFKPQKVRRVEIPKSNGKTRPLGIPCIEDRIIQQCIKQVLEPICEAKFHPNSYGFRPNRNTENAIAYLVKKINLDHNYYLVDMDIKGFFDNVSHGKLLKQMWTLGIRDKKVLSIISAMLKAEIDKEGIPNKGVPQGGILSPLLANIVLNELDWWISNQWETLKTKHLYSANYAKYNNLRRTSKLKEIFIVRYADDFKIICKNYNTANRIYNATEQWLNERLNLKISPEKSQINDIRQHPSEFLGFTIQAKQKRNKYIVKTAMTAKAKQNVEETLRNQIRYLQRSNNKYGIYILNMLIAGLHGYYRIATEINRDFSRIHYNLSYCLKSRLRSIITKTGYKSKEYHDKYEHYGGKVIYALGIAIYPINGIKTKPPMVCSQSICNYTEEGRKAIHTKLGYINKDMMNYLAHNPVLDKSVEYNDNRIALYAAQKGKCSITQQPLDITMEVHHKELYTKGEDDKYSNLTLIIKEVHKLIHATNHDIINKYLSILRLSTQALNKVNQYRMKIGNEIILSE